MKTFSHCQSCQGILEIVYVGQESHPTCPQTESEKLAHEFVQAIQRDDIPEMKRLEALLDAPRPEPKLGSSALWYAKHARWPVFPLKPGEKVPATRNGFKDATRSPAQIKAWWSEAPYNIGVPTGEATGFDVIDVDGEIGVRSLAQLEMDGHIPDVHGRVMTPRGVHLLIRGTNDGNRVGIRPGVDYRSAGGFVCVAPSLVNGKRYAWTIQPSPEIYGKD